jgi:TonB family protein
MTSERTWSDRLRHLFAMKIVWPLFLTTRVWAADAPPPVCPPKQMLSVIRAASRVYLIRLGRRESRDADPLNEQGRFLGFERLEVKEIEARRIKPLVRVFEKPESYACGDRPVAKSLKIPPVQIGFAFESNRGRVNLVLLEPEQRVEMQFSNGAYAESQLSERGASAWDEVLMTVLTPGQEPQDFYEAMRRPKQSGPAPAVIVAPSATPELAVDDSCLHAPEQDLEAVRKVPPEYPDLARNTHVDGEVRVRALVGPDGLVRKTEMAKSIPMLDEAAQVAVRQWRFVPATRNGATACAWTTVPVKFTLH